MEHIVEYKAIALGHHTWVYGYIVISDKTPLLHTNDGKLYHVIPQSISRYTGFKTKKGVKVFEGDILHKTNGCYVSWSEEGCYWGFQHVNDTIITPFFHRKDEMKKCNVYGNIHDKLI